MDIVERFLSKVSPCPITGCWWWTAACVSGYGVFKIRSPGEARDWKAHRVSFELFVRPIPAGLFVCHRCDQPSCVNPAHLFLGTGADNMADRDAKGRQMRGERHAKTRLTVADVHDIRSRCRPGHRWNASPDTYAALAKQYGLSRQAVRQIAVHRTWKHVV